MDVALVTGTNTGIGFATALHLARNEHKVYASMRDLAKGEALREAAAAEQLPLETIELDAMSDASMQAAVARILEAEGRIDVLVNNAGIGGGAPLEFMEPQALRDVMETNFFGPYRLMQLVIPNMRERRHGAIVNVTSLAGLIGFPIQSAYAASKFALEGTSQALAGEVRQHGIRVACVEPGVVETPIFDKQPDASPFLVPEFPYANNIRRLMGFFEAGRRHPAQPQDVADAILEAVTSATPKLRYPVGEDAHAMWGAVQNMPLEELVEISGAADDADFVRGMKEKLNWDPT